ncbi:unnamed protein product, partial [Polarella glacialis]
MPGVQEPQVITIIGMRGAGKSTLGKEAAIRLGLDFVDLDEAITSACDGKRPPQIVAESGWDYFRTVEADCYVEAVTQAKAGGTVIACGGGIIETDRGMELLRAQWPVVMIDRHVDDIVGQLEKTAPGAPAGSGGQNHRASLGEHPRATHTRRMPKYLEVLDFRFPVVKGEADLESLTRCFVRFLHRCLGYQPLQLVSDSFFVTVTLPEYVEVSPELLRSVAHGSDVLEFRVDLLASLEHSNIVQQVAAVRRATAGTPLLYTIRSTEHGGKFSGSEKEYFELNQLGLTVGVELLDLECTWDSSKINDFVSRKGSTLLVGSYHNFDRMPDRAELAETFRRCSLGGRAAAAKVVVKGGSREDNWIVQEVGAAEVPQGCAFIGLCLGEGGRLSRVLNQVLCPATHPRLQVGAPGQLTIQEILEARRRLSLLGPSRQFCIIGPWRGQGGSASSSLCDLQARLCANAFRELSLPHICFVEPAETVVEAQRLLCLASCGGAAIVGPLGQDLFPSLAGQASEIAGMAGCMDCLVRDKDGVIKGECVAAQCLSARLQGLGLSVGAGGRAGLILGQPGRQNPMSVRVVLSGLASLGIGRCLMVKPQASDAADVKSATFLLDRSGGGQLGFEVSDCSGGGLRVDSVGTEGLAAEWNQRNPGLRVVKGDRIVEVNGAGVTEWPGSPPGCVATVSKNSAALLEQLSREQILNVKALREPQGSPPGLEHLDDLASVASMTDIDVVVLADVFVSAEEIRAVTPLLERLKPIVVEMAWPPSELAAS